VTRASLAALAALLLCAAARADDEPRARAMTFSERGADLQLTVGFSELFDDAAVAALSSGFPSSVVVRVYVQRRRDELPIALAIARVDVVYDLWDEIYVIRQERAGGGQTSRTPSRSAAIEAATRLVGLPIAPLDRIAIGPHYVASVVAELNPVSDELQAEMRRWLTQPAGERLDAGSSFFGSFVSVFVKPRLVAADRAVHLRSQPFYRVAR
jgi:hypothetical protein